MLALMMLKSLLKLSKEHQPSEFEKGVYIQVEIWLARLMPLVAIIMALTTIYLFGKL